MVTLPLVFGLLVGSFLNVVIARVPEGRSVWAPRSACPHCGALIGWYDNIPLVSFLPLRGRCRCCRAGIPWRYPIVEAATGVAFALAYVLLGPPPGLLVASPLLGALIAITAIDLRHQIIPAIIALPGIAVGFVANSLLPAGVGWLQPLIGVAAGGGVSFAITILGGGGMGGGDMKLGAMLGAFLGWKLG